MINTNKGTSNLPVVVRLGFMPAAIIASGESSERAQKLADREQERMERKAQRLSNLEQVSGLFTFEASLWRTMAAEAGSSPMIQPKIHLKGATGGRQSEIGWSEIQMAFSDLPSNPFTAGDGSPTNYVNMVLTDGVLENQALAMAGGTGVILSKSAVQALTTKLMHDPWPALAVLFYLEVQEAQFAAKETKHGELGALHTFQKEWDVDDVHNWIKSDQGKRTIDAYEASFGSDGVERLKRLLDELPLPGGLDDPTVSSISYGDPPANKDLLNLRTYVEALNRVILNSQTATPLTIAVLGKWGKGKTSFMQFLRRGLEQHRPREENEPKLGEKVEQSSPLVPRAVTVWFDAWQYDSEEKVLAALLQTVAQEIEQHFTPYSWLKYRLRIGIRQLLESWQLAYKLLLNALIIPLVILISTIVVLTVGSQWQHVSVGNVANKVFEALTQAITYPGQHSAAMGFGLVLAIAYVAWRLWPRFSHPLGLDVSKLYEERNHADRLGFLTVFKEDFQRRINQMAMMPVWSLRSLPQYAQPWERRPNSLTDLGHDALNLVTAPMRWLKSSNSGAVPLRNRVVIFVDDLDRCRPPKIIDILEAIKVTLDTEGIIFVLGLDDSYIKSAIYLRYQEHIQIHTELHGEVGTAEPLGAEWPDRYLEKIIQLPFRLPDVTKDNLRSLLGGLLETQEKGEKRALGSEEPPRSNKKKRQEMKRAAQELQRYEEHLLSSADKPEINKLIFESAIAIGPKFGGNPRRVKDYVNRCRLGFYLLQLHSGELLKTEFEEAIGYFEEWELARALGQTLGSEDPLKDAADDWPARLRDIRRCLFDPPGTVEPPPAR